MFGMDRVVGSVDGPFDIADHSVHPFEFFPGYTLRSASGDDAVMVTTRVENSGKAGQAVRINQAAGHQVFFRPAGDFG